MKKTKLNILYQSNDSYAAITGVSMYSLFKNNTDIDELTVYLLDDGISKENLNKFKKLGKEYNVSTRTVLTYANYSKAIDKLNTEEPDLTQRILNGEIKVPQNQVIRISKLSPKIKNKIQKYLKKETNSTDYLIKPKTVANEKKYKIKEMPEYDPNAE